MRVIHSLEIKDEAQVGAARRATHSFAASLGFTETELAELDIVVQELGTNAARYAKDGGWLHYSVPVGNEHGIELFYWDKGPGIYDLDRAVRDGVSTSGSMGAGLGAIRRLMDEFDIYSTVKGTTRRLRLSSPRRTMHGTAILCRKWVAATRPLDRSRARTVERVGVWSRPARGEEKNGDAYFISRRKWRTLLAVIDGLGHGRGAHQASSVALESLQQWTGEPLEEVVWAAHEALRATRGAVMGVALMDEASETFYYTGVGNVEARVFGAPEPINMISVNGTLGARLSRPRVWTHKWPEGATILMSTDGISAAWDLDSYPGLLAKSPQLMAGVLVRDYGRDSDDATVLIAR